MARGENRAREGGDDRKITSGRAAVGEKLPMGVGGRSNNSGCYCSHCEVHDCPMIVGQGSLRFYVFAIDNIDAIG